MSTGIFTRGDLNCAATLEERTNGLMAFLVPVGGPCALLDFVWYSARGSPLDTPAISSRVSSLGIAGVVVCVDTDVILVCKGERKGAASFLRESF